MRFSVGDIVTHPGHWDVQDGEVVRVKFTITRIEPLSLYGWSVSSDDDVDGDINIVATAKDGRCRYFNKKDLEACHG